MQYFYALYVKKDNTKEIIMVDKKALINLNSIPQQSVVKTG